MIIIEKKRDDYIKVKTRDGYIEIYYEGDRTCVSYTNLAGIRAYQFSLRDGERLYLDGI